MASIFSRIIAGELPAHRVYEDDQCIAFLDIHPLVQGHTLVVPKHEVDYLFDVEDVLLAHLLPVCKKVGKAIEQVVSCERIGVSVIGLEVPHAHIHLIPINGLYDMDFTRPKLSLSNEELASIATRIREAM
ncbi:MAG: HIT family protein [Leptolyngbya sp. SIO3F4]|nr:HIT family protein [Leptolyngbya sp. SIO3F4]